MWNEQRIQAIESAVRRFGKLTVGPGLTITRSPNPIISLSYRAPARGFWALITDSTADVDGRNVYSIVQVAKADAAYDTWGNVTAGVSGTAYNAVENGAVPSGGFTPVPVDTAVWIETETLPNDTTEYWFSGGSASSQTSSSGTSYWARVGTVDGTYSGRWSYDIQEVEKGQAGYGGGNPWVAWTTVSGGRNGTAYNGAEMPSGVTYTQVPQGTIVLVTEIEAERWFAHPVTAVTDYYGRIDSYAASGDRYLYNWHNVLHSTAASATGFGGWIDYPSVSGVAWNLAEASTGAGYRYAPAPTGAIVPLYRTITAATGVGGYEYHFNLSVNTGINPSGDYKAVSGAGTSWNITASADKGKGVYFRILTDVQLNASTYTLEKRYGWIRIDPSQRVWYTEDTASWIEIVETAVCPSG